MQTGQTFVVDEKAVEEIATFCKKPLADIQALNLVGNTYSIAKGKNDGAHAITPIEVRASKWEDGKPKKGRPRAFPRHVIARLLGELNDPSLTNPLVQLAAATAPATSTEDAVQAAQAALDSAPVSAPEGVSEVAEPVAAASAGDSW